MANSFSTSVELYRPQFIDEELNKTVNLLAVEPYGHGETRATYADYTYWDSAYIANLQVLEALNIPNAFTCWAPPRAVGSPPAWRCWRRTR